MKLALKFLKRQWKEGEPRILFAAVFLAVAIVGGVSLFSERLHTAILQQSNRLLGADLVFESSTPVDFDTFKLPEDVEISRVTEFLSMLSSGDKFQLTEVWAVDNQFPLKGEVSVSDSLFGESFGIRSRPGRGEIWLDSRAASALDLAPGERVDIGETQLQFTQILVSLPGEGSNALMPLAAFNQADVEATGIVQVGSRVEYIYNFSGPPESIAELARTLRASQQAGQRVYDVERGQPRLAQAIDRARQYLILASTLAVLLAAAAIAIAARRFALEQEPRVAVLKTIGMTRADLQWLYLGQLTLIWLLATLLGIAAAFVIDHALGLGIKRALNLSLPAAAPKALLSAPLTGLFCMAVFAAPPILALRNTLPIRALRKEVGTNARLMTGLGALNIVALFAFVCVISGSIRSSMGLFLGLLLIVVVVGGVAWMLLRWSKLLGTHAGSPLRLATATLRRHAIENAFQVVIFATTLTLFLTILTLRTSLIGAWTAQIPEGTPNFFLVNIQQQELEGIRHWLSEQGLADEGLYPIVRARLAEINDLPIAEWRAQRGQTSRRDQREINLTSAVEMPPDNEIVEGQWWKNADGAEVSIEQDYAGRLGVNPGDTLTFVQGTREISGTITSIRSVDWEQMRPNFFIVVSPGMLEAFPAEYITSVFIPPEKKALLSQLMRSFPTIQVFAIDALIKQVKSIIRQVSIAVESILWLIVACGGLVLLATVRASQTERIRQSAILRTLGASNRSLISSLLIEFLILGVIAGLLAAAAAELVSAWLQIRVFELDYSPVWRNWWLGPAIGAGLIASLGMTACMRVIKQPAADSLRRLSAQA